MRIQKWSRSSTTFFVYLTFCASIFQGAAINLALFPISAPAISALLFLVFFFIQHNNLAIKVSISKFEYKFQKLLLPFTIYSILSAIAFPIIFSGLLVYLPRNGITIAPNGYLKFNISTLGQSIYLMLNYLFLVFLTRYNYIENKVSLIKIFQIMGLIAAVFSIYQLISIKYSLYYPSDIINSNKFSYQDIKQTILSGWPPGW